MSRWGLSLLAVAACGAAVWFGTTQLPFKPPVENGAATSTPPVVPPQPAARAQDAAALVTAPPQTNVAETKAAGAGATETKAAEAKAPDTKAADTKTLANVLAAPPASPDAEPGFDIARIEPSGDTVIAGTAAPGATVELLRNGEVHDQVVADASGQFVMVPPRLPAGNYELTLRSRQKDGRLATSKKSVAVALAAAEPGPASVPPRVATPSDVTGTVAKNRVAPDQAVGNSQARLVPEAATPSAGAAPKSATAVVSRGDSLWRISRVTYGDGARYAVLYRANRDRIRSPDRIYPGQVFVLPKAP